MSVRELAWQVEALHGQAYFSPEVAAAYAALGLRGYWRGYFAGRASAVLLHEPDADAARIVELFGGFAPRMVERALPEVFTIASPEDAYAARRDAAGATLARLAQLERSPVRGVLAELSARLDGRLDAAPMAAAEAARPDPEDDVAASCWHHATVLREFRGDQHLAAVAAAGIGWPAMHLLVEPTGRLDGQQREYRGWTEDEWAAARAELQERGLYDTDAGTQLIETIEADTDRRVANALGEIEPEMIKTLTIPALDSGLPFPNAMGLPAR